MALQLMILGVISVVIGFCFGLCCCFSSSNKERAEHLSERQRRCCVVSCPFLGIGGLLGLLWCLMTPPLFSKKVSGPPAHHRNDPDRSVYFGNGCFWHTQYDLAVLEQEPGSPFGGRSDHNVTSLVGYAGGRYQSASGTACYHGIPGTDYSRLGHAEAVSVTLDEISGAQAQAQISALAALYFEHGFATVDGKRQRLDPQDMGAEYRNVIGLPGGMDNAELWPLIVAANVHGMELTRGSGGTHGDTEDEYVVYVYDSRQFPFFRGEAYHQFHTNDVIKRQLPSSYTGRLKEVQDEMGRLDGIGCLEVPSEVGLLIQFGFALMVGVAIGATYAFRPRQLLCCDNAGTARVTVERQSVPYMNDTLPQHAASSGVAGDLESCDRLDTDGRSLRMS